jgi:hypothetical protein
VQKDEAGGRDRWGAAEQAGARKPGAGGERGVLAASPRRPHGAAPVTPLIAGAAIVLAGIAGLYLLYVVKAKLGIDVFPGWGLHLPGPRALARRIARRFKAAPGSGRR